MYEACLLKLSIIINKAINTVTKWRQNFKIKFLLFCNDLGKCLRNAVSSCKTSTSSVEIVSFLNHMT